MTETASAANHERKFHPDEPEPGQQMPSTPERGSAQDDGLPQHIPEDAVMNGYPHEELKPTTNGHASETPKPELDHEERPTKRQKTEPTTPKSASKKFKPESPPWKKHDAEGPTSYNENGRRKSGRINTVPIEHQPPGSKRLTRRSLHGSGSSSKPTAAPPSRTSGRQSSTTQNTSPQARLRQRHSDGSKTKSSATPTDDSNKKRGAATRRPSTTTRRRTPSPSHSKRHSTRVRRSARFEEDHDSSPGGPTQPGRSPRIKLRLSRSGVIPLVHADQVRKRPRIGASFDDFWEKAGEIPVEEGGLYASEDGPPYTDGMAQREAHTIMRIEESVEPGGILSRERCSLFAPEGGEEPPRQYAWQDHMIKAMANFRRLLLAEQQRHRQAAKRLAEACRDEWVRRQPKSAEQIEAEAREKWIARYRQVAKVMFGTWENVRAFVNRQRLEEWEAEEQKRVKAALNEAVNMSEMKLQARRGVDSEHPSDDDGFDDMSDDDSSLADSDIDSGTNAAGSATSGQSDEDSDNMSSSGDEEEELKDGADEGLTQEQLREKYAGVQEAESQARQEMAVHEGNGEATPAPSQVDGAETSDESVDMDDDMGSSDTDTDNDESSDQEGSDEEDEASGDEQAGGLLGLFFGKSELKQLEAGSPVDAESTNHGGQEVEAENPQNHHSDMTNGDTAHLIDVPQSNGTHEPSEAVVDNVTSDKPEQLSSDHPQKPRSELNGVHPNGPETIDQEMVDQGVTNREVVDPEKADQEMVDRETADQETADQETTGGAQQETKPAQLEGEPTSPKLDKEMVKQPHLLELPQDQSEGPVPLAASLTSKLLPSRSETPLTHASTHKTDIPFLLRGTLREYQHDGLDWLAGLYGNNTNGILADEMGLGKTIQTIALLAHLACQHEVWGPHLVVVPTSVMLNWEMEFKKWCPGFKILAYYGTQEERKRKRQGWRTDDMWNVCITSYQLVLQDQQVFKRRRWHYMILDEAHNIKNFKSQRWQTLLGFNTHSRLLLTGTPLQNNLTELWSLLFFLMPAENGVGGFADLQEFHDWFQKPESQILESGREQMDDEAKAIISKLHKVLRPYLLRRLKADVEKQMPGKYEHVEFCRLSKRQRELYDGFLARADTKNTLSSGNYMSIINCLMQLRKVCNHPDLFVDRPIITSMRMQTSVVAAYDEPATLVRRWLQPRLMSTVDLSFLNLVPTHHEDLSGSHTDRISQLSSHRALMDLRETQRSRSQNVFTMLDPSTVESSIAYLERASRWGRFEELQHCVYLNALRRQQRPIYGQRLRDLVTIDAHKRPYRPRPKVPSKVMAWFEGESNLINAAIWTLDQRADSLKTIIEKFSCVTPVVVTRDLDQFIFGRKGLRAFSDEDLKLSAPVRWAPFLPKEKPLDPWHEARMRLTIQFPDKRLLQYDCGKLQALDKLLRKLQMGGHRALIFTQMTKVLDILEQFLNIHGHKYLRLDGATKVEQRQILTDRFNHDPRILCFILSTRSGGLGINLTGADTVIFYDQDWNPAMDKQCQDRCHRIGQTRDVHIYRLVSEHTIEANILRKASQKQMLDDVVIQEGEFTTDHFNKVSVRDVLGDKLDFTSEGVSAADAALDRVLGGPDTSQNERQVGRVLEQAEDREDVTAARVAEREIQADDADFSERPTKDTSGTSTARQGTPADQSLLEGALPDADDNVDPLAEVELNAFGVKMNNVDEFLVRFMREELKHTKLDIPKDKKKGKKRGKDTRKR